MEQAGKPVRPSVTSFNVYGGISVRCNLSSDLLAWSLSLPTLFLLNSTFINVTDLPRLTGDFICLLAMSCSLCNLFCGSPCFKTEHSLSRYQNSSYAEVLHSWVSSSCLWKDSKDFLDWFHMLEWSVRVYLRHFWLNHSSSLLQPRLVQFTEEVTSKSSWREVSLKPPALCISNLSRSWVS
jgi:hypothetical protein